MDRWHPSKSLIRQVTDKERELRAGFPSLALSQAAPERARHWCRDRRSSASGLPLLPVFSLKKSGRSTRSLCAVLAPSTNRPSRFRRRLAWVRKDQDALVGRPRGSPRPAPRPERQQMQRHFPLACRRRKWSSAADRITARLFSMTGPRKPANSRWPRTRDTSTGHAAVSSVLHSKARTKLRPRSLGQRARPAGTAVSCRDLAGRRFDLKPDQLAAAASPGGNAGGFLALIGRVIVVAGSSCEPIT